MKATHRNPHSRSSAKRRRIMAALQTSLTLLSSLCVSAWPGELTSISDLSAPHHCADGGPGSHGEPEANSCNQPDALTPARGNDPNDVPHWFARPPIGDLAPAGVHGPDDEAPHLPVPTTAPLRPHLLNARFNE